MLLTWRAAPQHAEARAIADRIGLRIQLETCLAYLDRYADERPALCVLYPDPAPYSFQFVMMELEWGETDAWVVWFEGRLVYRAPHDDHPAAFPSLVEQLEPAMGWSIRM